jgi:chromosome segregation ATPase
LSVGKPAKTGGNEMANPTGPTLSISEIFEELERLADYVERLQAKYRQLDVEITEKIEERAQVQAQLDELEAS